MDKEALRPPEARSAPRQILKRVSSRVFSGGETVNTRASATEVELASSQVPNAERAFVPRQLSSWFANLNRQEAAKLPSDDARRSPSLRATLPNPVSINSAGNRAGSRVLGAGLLERAVNYFTDGDASFDRCPDPIWLIGGVCHEGWRAEETTIHERLQERPSTGKKPRRRSSTPSAVSPGDKSPARSKLKSALARKRSRTSLRPVQSGSSPIGRDASSPGLLATQPLSPSAIAAPDPPSPSVLSFGGSAGTGSTTTTSSALMMAQSGGWPLLFWTDFASRMQLTYRSGFSPIPCTAPQSLTKSLSTAMSNLTASLRSGSAPSNATEGLTSDAGWGCMLRTGQSLLANALAFVHLGRDWRRSFATSLDAVGETPPAFATYVRLLTWFLDDPSPLCPFSVHRFALKGQELGKQVGEWFGPSTAAGAIRSLTNAFPPAGLAVVSAIDGTLYESEVQSASIRWTKPVLILLNVRLGLNGVNPIYYDSIKALFELPQLVGIAGGRPSSSYFFVGSQADSLFYIDPHHTKPHVPLRSPPDHLDEAARTAALASALDDWETVGTSPAETRDRDLEAWFSSAYSEDELRSYHCERVRKMPLSGLDPSMLIGLLCQSQADFAALCEALKRMKTPLVGVAARVPAWARTASFGNAPAREAASSTSPPSSDLDSESAEEVETSLNEPDDAWLDEGSEDDFSLASERRVDGFVVPDVAGAQGAAPSRA